MMVRVAAATDAVGSSGCLGRCGSLSIHPPTHPPVDRDQDQLAFGHAVQVGSFGVCSQKDEGVA